MKIMRQEIESLINGLIFLILVFIIFSWIYRPYIIEYNAEKDFLQATHKNINDKNSLFYVDLCKNIASIKEQVNCVMLATSPIYHYTKDQERTKIRTPTQYAKLGGNCKDSAILYATIFKNLNYTIKFEFPIPHHITTTIYKKIGDNIYKYCNIEGNTATCYEVII